MFGRVNDRQDYAVVVEMQGAGCVWLVTRADSVAMSGHAPNRETASRCGALAATTLAALERISRRRF
jgi:hypothetical protein